MSRTIVFVGTHPHSSVDDLDLPDNAELWCANEANRGIGARRPFRIFQMHPRDWREAERRYLHCGILPEGCDPDCFGRNDEHVEYLRECGITVYAERHWRDIPTSERYPFDQVTATVGIALPPSGSKRLWATSTFGYMAALALTEHLGGIPITEIGLAGVELPIGSTRERTWEWPNLAYYLGLAQGLGIELLLPRNGTSLLSAPLYAVDGHPQPLDPDHWWVPGEAGIKWEDGVYRLGKPEPEPVRV